MADPNDPSVPETPEPEEGWADGRAAATSYNFLKGVTPGPFSKLWLKGSAIAENAGIAPEGFTKAGVERLRELEANPHTGYAALGQIGGSLAQAYLGGKVVGKFINPGQVAANAALPNSRVLASAAGAAADGALYGAYGSGVEQASRDYLDSGEVNSDHVWAAAKEGAGYGALLGGVLGGGISLIAEKGPGAATKLGQFIERKAGIGYLERSGVKEPVKIAGSEAAAAEAAATFHAKALEAAGADGKAKPLLGTLESVIEDSKATAKKAIVGTEEGLWGRADEVRAAADMATDGANRVFADRAKQAVAPFLVKNAEVSAPFYDRLALLDLEARELANHIEGRAAVPVEFMPMGDGAKTGAQGPMGKRAVNGMEVGPLRGTKTPPSMEPPGQLMGGLEHGSPANSVDLPPGFGSVPAANANGSLERVHAFGPNARVANDNIEPLLDMRIGAPGMNGSQPLRPLGPLELEAKAKADPIRGRVAAMSPEQRIARLQEVQKEVAKVNAEMRKAVDPIFREKEAAMRKLVAKLNAEHKAVGKAASKELEGLNKGLELLEKLQSDPRATWGDLRQAAKRLEDLHPGAKGLREQVEVAITNASLAHAMRESIKAPDPLGFSLKNFIKRAGRGSVTGLMGYAVGGKPGAVIGELIGAGVDARFAPDTVYRAAKAGNGALKVLAQKFAIEGQANAALQAMGRSYVPAAGAGVRAYTGDRDAKVHSDVTALNKSGQDPKNLAEVLEKVELPQAYKNALIGKAAEISANVRANAPKPILMGGPFGTSPKYADSDIMDFEEYVSAASDPHVGLSALKRGSLTMAQAKAMRENYPDIVAQVRKSLLDHAGAPMSEQAILQLERLFGEPLVMEHSGDYVQLAQRVYDQMNRTNTPGSQGGGSPPAQNTPHVRLSRTDSERIQER